MRHRIGVLLIAAAFAGLAPAPAVLAQDASQTQSFSNQIEGLEVAEQGGAIYVRLTLREPLASPPPSFSVDYPSSSCRRGFRAAAHRLEPQRPPPGRTPPPRPGNGAGGR